VAFKAVTSSDWCEVLVGVNRIGEIELLPMGIYTGSSGCTGSV
jgi:hypothetical protein